MHIQKLSTSKNRERERKTANAYLTFLQSKGAPSSMLYLRSKFLDAFILQLTGKIQTRKEFAYTLESVLENQSQDDRSHALNTGREFFPFWMNDIKAIAMFEEYYAFSANQANWMPKHKTLKSLTDELESEILTEQEKQSLDNYINAITKLGADNTVIETRTKLSKIILIRLREAPANNHATYRIAVDLTLPLFKRVEIKKLYLDVVREFYYFWRDDPAAMTKVFGKS